MDEIRTRETLLLKIRNHADNDAWAEFVALYTPLIYRFCASRGVSETDIPDIAQETLQRVMSGIKSFDYEPEKGKFRSWLFRVTYSRLSRHFEKANKQPKGTGRTTIHRMLEEIPSEEVEADWDLEYRRQMFDWAAAKVEPEVEEKTWQAFWDTAVEDRPGAAVAESLGMSVGAVYVAK